jgi:AAA+ superfamily predicted ATPase
MADIFDDTLGLPDPGAHRRYAALQGLDETKDRLLKQASILLRPSLLDAWVNKHHAGTLGLVELLRDRPPLFIFGGDVGTGKTTLAETFGDPIGRELGIDVEVMRLSLNSRGSGMVGEMTTLITDAFAAVKEQAPVVADGQDPSAAVVLLIDEADALAQSRENTHMHHEDRAGVNALIRGIDSIATERRPVITVLCTNRLDAIDPAVRRRAFEFEFARPDADRRKALLANLFDGVQLTPGQVGQLADLTGENGRGYPWTYSDLTQRLVSASALAAFPDAPITFEVIKTAVQSIEPTPPFGANTP